MDKISEQIRQLIASGGRTWSFEDQTINVAINDQARHQCVEIVTDGDEYVLTCIVLGCAHVTRSAKHWDELARLAWQRNAEQEVVAFGFDRQNRLIGQIRHPRAHLDIEELDLYVHSLARECDRFEYLLSGKDEY